MLINISNGELNFLANKSSNTREQKILCCLFLNRLGAPQGGGRLQSGGFRLREKVAQTFNSELETKFAFLNGTLLI